MQPRRKVCWLNLFHCSEGICEHEQLIGLPSVENKQAIMRGKGRDGPHWSSCLVEAALELDERAGTILPPQLSNKQQVTQ